MEFESAAVSVNGANMQCSRSRGGVAGRSCLRAGSLVVDAG